MESLPTNVKVSGMIYTIEEQEKPELDGESVWGFCDYKACKIVIRDSLSFQKKMQTLAHEVTHAIFHESNLDEQTQNEDIVNQFSLVAYQVIKDNNWIRELNEASHD